jgi:hypothetical protein
VITATNVLGEALRPLGIASFAGAALAAASAELFR